MFVIQRTGAINTRALDYGTEEKGLRKPVTSITYRTQMVINGKERQTRNVYVTRDWARQPISIPIFWP